MDGYVADYELIDKRKSNSVCTLIPFLQMSGSSSKTKPSLLREPPPSLFLGPPSLNTSRVSLMGAKTSDTVTNEFEISAPSIPLWRESLFLSPKVSFGPLDNSEVSPDITEARYSGYSIGAGGKKKIDELRPDVQWAEMQSTLKEVEISCAAAANRTHVFGGQHSEALEGLRRAQIELAKAWARSEADELAESVNPLSQATSSSGAATNHGADTGDKINAGKDSGDRDGTTQHDFEADIILARKRREANDRYFQRMNESVLDVVSRLEDVASSMQAVARESKEIWQGLDVDTVNDVPNTNDSDSR